MLLSEMQVFYYVVECGGFSKAAARLNMSKSFVSKKIKKLEEDLQARLVHRDSRKLRLTSSGETFYVACRDVVAKGQEGYDSIQELKGKPAGSLKISLPPAVALHLMESILPDFIKQYPSVKLDFHLESHVVDIVKGGYDLVFRAAQLPDSTLIARKILSYKHCICSTSQYLDQQHKIYGPDDLSTLNFILYNQNKKATKLHFKHNTVKKTIMVYGSILSDNSEFIKSLVLRGLGIGVFPEYVVRENIRSKQLIRCLEDYSLPEGQLYAIYPDRNFMQPKLRVFLDFIFSHFDE
jgi:DNA-binding transcriptional LysR family regulator